MYLSSTKRICFGIFFNLYFSKEVCSNARILANRQPTMYFPEVCFPKLLSFFGLFLLLLIIITIARIGIGNTIGLLEALFITIVKS